MKVTFEKLIATGILCLSSMSANSTIINVDLNSINDGIQFYDDSTGLTWLDVSVTKGMSIQESLDRYSGHRLATRSEVTHLFTELFSDVGLDASSEYHHRSDTGFNTLFSDSFNNFSSVAGYTHQYSVASYDYSYGYRDIAGWFADGDDFGLARSRQGSSTDRDEDCNAFTCNVTYDRDYFQNVSFYEFDIYNSSSSSHGVGTFMIQNTASVSEPTSLPLLGLGLIGLGFARKKLRT